MRPLNGSLVEAFAASLGFQEQRTLENGDLVEEIDIPAYFPGTTDVASASPIEVAGGSDIVGMDFILSDPVSDQRVEALS